MITDVEALQRRSGLNRFGLVNALAARSADLARGAPPAVRTKLDDKAVSIACAEILAKPEPPPDEVEP